MGRSSQEQALQNRARIVETASGLFRRSGVDSVSVADVMKAAGMTVGGFYKHFASKDALVQEALILSFSQAAESWLRISHQDKPKARGSGAIIDHYFKEKAPEQTCPMIAFAPHAPAEAYSKGAEKLLMQFLDHMHHARMNGCYDAASEREAKVLFAAMIGAKFLTRAAGNAEWVGSVRDAVSEMASPASPQSIVR
ncbi:TetR/AcrR family transcriptional regulator [Paracoccus sp. NGMCC 1.201697]|uniref:TetR/AcrR family transcriptional regulator n=1 Tax=Paracoccus broussonetiae subsp. drimophilus TaxID=3373869 RepID=A0ABW7LLS7_9RHOB